MSQYKVLPSYSEISPINPEYEQASSFANFSLIFSPEGTDGHEVKSQQVSQETRGRYYEHSPQFKLNAKDK